MTRSTRFVDAFWDPDITSTKGCDVICRRMKEGKKVCKELEEYLRERAKAESSYAKALANIAKKLEGKDIGDLEAAFLELRNQTEKIGTIHEHAGSHFNALATEVNSFSNDQTRQKQLLEQSLKNQQANKLNLYNKSMNLKEKYTTKCREKDNAEEMAKTAHKSVTTKTSEIAKADQREEKAKEAMKQAELAYKSSVDSVENARKSWETDMERVCKEFQILEERRIEFTRQQLWKTTNVDSSACVSHDENAENVRKTLEKCDIQREIQTFINNNNDLGNKRPEPVLYESYYKRAEPQDKRRIQQPLPAAPTGRPPMNPPQPSAGRHPPIPAGRPPVNHSQVPAGRPQINPPQSPGGKPPIDHNSRPPMIPPTSRQPAVAQLITIDDEDPSYSTLACGSSAETAVHVAKSHSAAYGERL